MTPSTVPCASCGKLVRAAGAMTSPDNQLYHQGCPEPAPLALGEVSMEVPAEDFGDVGLTRLICDYCKGNVVVDWKGRYGDYCSDKCRIAAESKIGVIPMSDMNAQPAVSTAPVTPDKPIVAGGAPKKATTKKKASAKKASAKAAPAAKAATKKAATKKAAAPAKASANGRGSRIYNNETVINVLGGSHEYKGLRGDSIDTIKDGMTIAKFRAALAKKGGRLNTYVGWAINTALANKLIKLSQPAN